MPGHELDGDERAAITDLLARYAFCLDTYDLDGYLETFLPDGVLVSEGVAYRGHAAIRAFLEARGRTPNRKHFAGLSSVTGDKDRCAVRTYYMLASGDDQACTLAAFGEYADRCVKIGGKWRFQERICTRHFGTMFPLGATEVEPNT